MAWYDDVTEFVWPNALVVVGVAVLAPVLLPAVGYVVRPPGKVCGPGRPESQRLVSGFCG